MKQKRQEGVASGKTTEEQTKKKTVQSAPEREKKQPQKPSVSHAINE